MEVVLRGVRLGGICFCEADRRRGCDIGYIREVNVDFCFFMRLCRDGVILGGSTQKKLVGMLPHHLVDAPLSWP